MKIVVLDGYTLNPGDLSWNNLKQLGDVEIYDRTPADKILERSKDAQVLLTNKTPLESQVLEQLHSLKYIGVTATGYNIVSTEVAKQKGYSIKLLYIWLNDINLAIERVAIRVKDGGHDIPEEVIVRRYKKGLRNLTGKFISVCDYWLVADNSVKTLTFMAEGFAASVSNIYNDAIWQNINEMANE